MKKKDLKKRRFSLLEMMAVLVLIGLVLAIAAPNVIAILANANVKATRNTFKSVESAVKQYKLIKQKYPESLDDLVKEKILEEFPQDAWGNKLRYNYPGAGSKAFDLISNGADGVPGGTDENADLSNTDEVEK